MLDSWRKRGLHCNLVNRLRQWNKTLDALQTSTEWEAWINFQSKIFSWERTPGCHVVKEIREEHTEAFISDSEYFWNIQKGILKELKMKTTLMCVFLMVAFWFGKGECIDWQAISAQGVNFWEPAFWSSHQIIQWYFQRTIFTDREEVCGLFINWTPVKKSQRQVNHQGRCRYEMVLIYQPPNAHVWILLYATQWRPWKRSIGL
jgi:hypothetical protein